jgi:hypothetical protein
VEVDLRAVVQELTDRSALVGREVVEDDVDLLAPRLRVDYLPQESDELLPNARDEELTARRTASLSAPAVTKTSNSCRSTRSMLDSRPSSMRGGPARSGPPLSFLKLI